MANKIMINGYKVENIDLNYILDKNNNIIPQEWEMEFMDEQYYLVRTDSNGNKDIEGSNLHIISQSNPNNITKTSNFDFNNNDSGLNFPENSVRDFNAPSHTLNSDIRNHLIALKNGNYVRLFNDLDNGQKIAKFIVRDNLGNQISENNFVAQQYAVNDAEKQQLDIKEIIEIKPNIIINNPQILALDNGNFISNILLKSDFTYIANSTKNSGKNAKPKKATRYIEEVNIYDNMGKILHNNIEQVSEQYNIHSLCKATNNNEFMLLNTIEQKLNIKQYDNNGQVKDKNINLLSNYADSDFPNIVKTTDNKYYISYKLNNDNYIQQYNSDLTANGVAQKINIGSAKLLDMIAFNNNKIALDIKNTNNREVHLLDFANNKITKIGDNYQSYDDFAKNISPLQNDQGFIRTYINNDQLSYKIYDIDGNEKYSEKISGNIALNKFTPITELSNSNFIVNYIASNNIEYSKIFLSPTRYKMEPYINYLSCEYKPQITQEIPNHNDIIEPITYDLNNYFTDRYFKGLSYNIEETSGNNNFIQNDNILTINGIGDFQVTAIDACNNQVSQKFNMKNEQDNKDNNLIIGLSVAGGALSLIAGLGIYKWYKKRKTNTVYIEDPQNNPPQKIIIQLSERKDQENIDSNCNSQECKKEDSNNNISQEEQKLDLSMEGSIKSKSSIDFNQHNSRSFSLIGEKDQNNSVKNSSNIIMTEGSSEDFSLIEEFSEEEIAKNNPSQNYQSTWQDRIKANQTKPAQINNFML